MSSRLFQLSNISRGFVCMATRRTSQKRWTRAVSCRFIPTFSLSSLRQPLLWSGSHVQAFHAVIAVILGRFPSNTEANDRDYQYLEQVGIGAHALRDSHPWGRALRGLGSLHTRANSPKSSKFRIVAIEERRKPFPCAAASYLTGTRTKRTPISVSTLCISAPGVRLALCQPHATASVA